MKRIIAKILIIVVTVASVMAPFDSSQAVTKRVGYVKVGKYYYNYNAKGEKTKYLQIIDGKPYYFMKNGRAAKKGWMNQKNGSKSYCYGKGRLAVGYVKIGKYYYYFNKNGRMKTSLQTIKGEPYYFTKNGRGSSKKWISDDNGNIRYCLGKGKLATGTVMIKGKPYYFSEEGLYYPDFSITKVPESKTEIVIFAGKKYKMHCQYARDFKGYNEYLAAHGCTLTTLTCVLGAYVKECRNWTPYHTLTKAEKPVVGETTFKKNYKKELEKRMPITFYTVSKILKKYGIDHQYVQSFSSDAKVRKDMIGHLKKGKPIIFVVSRHNRTTGEWSSKWTSSYHTMLMIGIDENNNVIIGNPAGTQRFQLVPIDEMISYMWSCTKVPNGLYWNGKQSCGGYIKITE